MGHPGGHGEHPLGDLGQLIFLTVFLVVWILDSFVLKFSIILAHYFPLYIRLTLACLILVLVVFLVRSGHRAISEDIEKNPRVIKDGAFARVRHPLYLAALLIYLFLICLSPSLISAGLFIVIFFFYNYIAGYEEKYLINKFGQDYRDYKKKAPKWIPRFKTVF